MKTKLNKIYLGVAICLGDGWIPSIRKGGNTTTLCCAHNPKHLDLLTYKQNLLLNLNISSKISFYARQGGKTKGYPIVQLFTKSSYLNRVLRNKIYINNEKIFNKRWIQFLDAEALAIFWMDDGCLFTRKKKLKNGSVSYHLQGNIATQNFSQESNNNILMWLKKFNIIARLTKKKNKYCIDINKTNVLKLIDVVSPFVKLVPSMVYKIDKNKTI
jgi:hypothetical protein